MHVFYVHMYSYMPVSRTSLWTRSTVLRRTLSAAVSAPSAFPSIYLNSLSFSFSKKLLTLITTFFKSDDIAFLFGILTACDTRCH